MALPPAFLDELRARTPLHGLVGRKVRLVRNGRQWKACCPFHNEKTPSFYVYDDHFHCFGCGAHGDAITFLMRAEGASFPEAVERLAAEAGLEVPKPSREARAREQRARDLHGVLAAAEAAFRARLHRPEGRAALDYLRRRGLSDETIARFGLGWSGEGRGALAAELKAEGIEPAQLVEAGLMKAREDGAGICPNTSSTASSSRSAIGAAARSASAAAPSATASRNTSTAPKRRCSRSDAASTASTSPAKPPSAAPAVVAVEGYMDVIALHQAGFDGAVAPLGTALTAEQMGALWQLSPEPVLCFDGDAAGARAAARAAELALPLLAPERTLRLATLPAGEDPDTLLAKGGAAAVRAVLDGARPLSAALYDLLDGRPAERQRRSSARRSGTGWKRPRAGGRQGARRGVPADAAGPLLRLGAQKKFQSGACATARADRPAGHPLRARAQSPRHPVAPPGPSAEVEEPLAGLDLPEGHCTTLRAALLAWLARADVLDSALLLDQLAFSGAGEAVAWALRGPGLAKEARPEAQPAEALDGWWHFFAFLRGEAELAEDCARAERSLVASNDPAEQQRLIRLTQARAALRAGEAGLNGAGAATESWSH